MTTLPEAERRTEAVQLGSRLEPFVDDWLIAKMRCCSLRLHHPVAREVVLTFDRPWEGNTCYYYRVFRDGDLVRLYYRGSDFDWTTRQARHQFTCYAESRDGLHWIRPELGLFEYGGSTANSIIHTGPGRHNFAPFRDENPDCPDEHRYKALGGTKGGLIAYSSPDGIHWRPLRDDPVITQGAFDSQNLAFWDSVRGHYVDFHRGFRDGVRDIMTCTSADFLNWTDPVWLDYGTAPREHLYTNATVPYWRAPHVLLAFPKRFMHTRKRVLDHPYPGVSDSLLMTSRDGGRCWHKWREAFLRPGPMRERWWQRNNSIAWGLLATEAAAAGMPDEISLYSCENYYIGPCSLRRFTLRTDGFASIQAPARGGEAVTRPLVFSGRELVLNLATSAAGSVRVEIREPGGGPVPGFSLRECPEMYGDAIEEVVRWKNGSDVGAMAGRPVVVRFVMKDADLYSLRFRE